MTEPVPHSPTDNAPDVRTCIDKHVDLDEGNVRYFVGEWLKDDNVTEFHVVRHWNVWGPSFDASVHRAITQYTEDEGESGENVSSWRGQTAED